MLGRYVTTDTPYPRPDSSILFVGQSKETIDRLALDDIHAGKTVVYIGDCTELLSHFPKRDVVFFDPAIPFQFNVFRGADPEIYAKTLTTALKGMWGYGDNTPTLDMYLQTGIQTLIGVDDTSLISLYFFLTDKRYRKQVMGHVRDPVLEHFWDRYERLNDKQQLEETRSTLSKVWPFVLSSKLRNCLIQKDNRLSFTNVSLIHLQDHILGRETASLFGVLSLTDFYMAAQKGGEYSLFVPDAGRYGISILSNILTLPNVTAHLGIPFLASLDERLRPAFLSAIPTLVCFRVGVDDAEELNFDIKDGQTKLYALPDREAWVREMFVNHIETFLHDYPLTRSERIAKISRHEYATDKSVPEERLRKLLGE